MVRRQSVFLVSQNRTRHQQTSPLIIRSEQVADDSALHVGVEAKQPVMTQKDFTLAAATQRYVRNSDFDRRAWVRVTQWQGPGTGTPEWNAAMIVSGRVLCFFIQWNQTERSLSVTWRAPSCFHHAVLLMLDFYLFFFTYGPTGGCLRRDLALCWQILLCRWFIWCCLTGRKLFPKCWLNKSVWETMAQPHGHDDCTLFTSKGAHIKMPSALASSLVTFSLIWAGGPPNFGMVEMQQQDLRVRFLE